MKSIRALRQARGWTQFELALRVGVQPQAVYLWESGRRVPQVPQLRKLGETFGLCSDEIELEEPPPGDRRAPRRGAGRRAAGGARGRIPAGQAPAQDGRPQAADADGA